MGIATGDFQSDDELRAVPKFQVIVGALTS